VVTDLIRIVAIFTREINVLDDTRFRAAQVELLALEAGLSEISTDAGHSFFMGSQGPLSRDEAALTLAALSKPVRCVAETQNGSTLIRCEAPADQRESNGLVQLGTEDGAEFTREIESQFGGQVVLVVSRNDELVVSLDVIRRWFAEYVSAAAFRLAPPTACYSTWRVCDPPVICSTKLTMGS